MNNTRIVYKATIRGDKPDCVPTSMYWTPRRLKLEYKRGKLVHGTGILAFEDPGYAERFIRKEVHPPFIGQIWECLAGGVFIPPAVLRVATTRETVLNFWLDVMFESHSLKEMNEIYDTSIPPDGTRACSWITLHELIKEI